MKYNPYSKEVTNRDSSGEFFFYPVTGRKDKGYPDFFYFKPHWHVETEIIFSSINSEIIIDGKKFELKEGDICIINSGETHEMISTQNGEIKAFVFSLNILDFSKPDFFQTKILNRLKKGEILLPNVIRKNDITYRELFKAINQFEESSKYNKNRHRLIIMELLDFCYWNEIFQEREILQEEPSQFEKIIASTQYIAKKLNKELTIKELSEHVGMSRFHYIRTFKKFMDCTPFEYIQNLRIEKSCFYLSQGYNVTETALECGFNSASFFSIVFKRTKGMSPKEWKKNS